MTIDPSPANFAMTTQQIQPQHLQPSLSQQSSGLEVSDYGVAEQSQPSPQDRQESSDVQGRGNTELKGSSEVASGLHEELIPTSDQPELEAQSQRSSSQEQNAESQYSPITVAPVNGQMCR